MLGQNVANRTEEFRQKKEELKRRIIEEELRRVESETDARGQELAKVVRSKDELLFQEQMREAQAKRQQEESDLKQHESEIQARLAEERQKKQARRLEEERLRREEELRVREEEARRKADEERARLEEEARRQAEEERQRFEEEARKKAEAERLKLEAEAHRKADEKRQRFEEEARNRADEERHRQEEQLRLQREEFQRKEEERRRQEEQRRIEAEQHRKEAEDKHRREEEEQRRLAEEQRVREEAERRKRQEEEERLRKEEELRLQLEEQQRQEDEATRRRAEELQRQREEQIRKEKAEKQARIQELVAQGQALYSSGEFKAALVEVAKALVNDPNHRGALKLEAAIKEQLEIVEPKSEAPSEPLSESQPSEPKRPKKKQRANLPPKFESVRPRKRDYSKYFMPAAIIAVISIAAVLFFHFKDQMFPRNISFAIVPWSSTANIPEETILGSSLSEEVARQFERQKKSVMMGFASSYGISQTMTDPVRAIMTLGYPYVLQGSVTKSAGGYNISVRLVDSVGSVYWAQSFIKSEASLPDLPTEIATQLAKSIGLSTSKEGVGSFSGRTTSNSSAYLIYLRALELMHRQTKESTRNAAALFKQAIELDENFAAALAAASTALVTLSEEGWDESDSVLTQATNYAEKAIRWNSSSAAAYVALGRILSIQKDYKSAFDKVQTGLRNAPGNSDLHLQKAKTLMIWGKMKEAIDELTAAYELNPRDPHLLRMFGYAYQISGAPQQATWYHQSAAFFVSDSTAYIVGPLADALMVDPSFSIRESRRVADAFERRLLADPRSYLDMYRYARMLQITGKHLEGSAMLDRTEKVLRAELQAHPKNTDALIHLGLTLTRLGKFAEATALARKAGELEKNNPMIKYKMAQMLSLQMYSAQKKKTDEKKKEEALVALRDAVRLSYNFDELANADFFNMYQEPEYRTAIQAAGQ